jgi:hypothetical protein
MKEFIPVLGVAFAAFSVWLAVRIINRRERWAKRTAVVLVTTGLFVSAYVTAYTRMVRPSLSEEWVGFQISHFTDWSKLRIDLVPVYVGFDSETSVDQDLWENVFAPAHWVDRRIRCDEWVIGDGPRTVLIAGIPMAEAEAQKLMEAAKANQFRPPDEDSPE